MCGFDFIFVGGCVGLWFVGRFGRRYGDVVRGVYLRFATVVGVSAFVGDHDLRLVFGGSLGRVLGLGRVVVCIGLGLGLECVFGSGLGRGVIRSGFCLGRVVVCIGLGLGLECVFGSGLGRGVIRSGFGLGCVVVRIGLGLDCIFGSGLGRVVVRSGLGV